MKKPIVLTVTLAAIGFCPAAGLAAVLYSSSMDSPVGWTVVASSADTAATFGFDYSAIGVPPSPNGGGSTLGLKMEANIAAPTSTEAIMAYPDGQYFSSVYQLTFDMWINAIGPFPGGGAGSTEFLTAGIGSSGTLNFGGISGSGGWFAVDGEGGSTRDYRAYKNVGEQFAESGQWFAGLSSAGGGAHNNSDPYYAGFGGIDVAAAVPAQTALHPSQTGVTAIGSAGFAWHEVTITVVGTTATWEIDGLPIARLDTTIGSTFPLDGNIAVGYMDIFSSVSGNAAVTFGLIDNLVVTDVPEPTTLGLLLVGGLACARLRRKGL